MALLQISEPGQSPQPHQRKHAVGIDLGTTNSLVATVRICSEAVGQTIQRLRDRARALRRQHVESSSLRATFELCRRATGQAGTVPIGNSFANDLVHGFKQ